jgi:hypothetical protein
MAARDFSPSVILDAQVALDQMYATPNTAKTSLLAGRAETARAVLPRQTARTVDRLLGNKVVGVQAFFYRSGAADIEPDDFPDDCDVPVGVQGETFKKDYETSVLAMAGAQVGTNRSDNLIVDADELAESMADICARLRRQLNRNVLIQGFAANAQANLDALINPSWDDTTNTPRITVPDADFTWENLNEFRIVAKNNNFGNFMMLSGRLFNDNAWLAMLNRMNEGERAAYLAYAQRELYFDEADLDDALGRKSAFAIDINSYLFWNTYRSGSTPAVITGNSQIFRWAIPDPSGLQWNNNGQLTPVIYEFEMQADCADRDVQQFHQAEINLSGRLLGGFEFVPEGPTGETGVLYFSNE